MMEKCDFLIIDDSEIDQTITRLLLSTRLGINRIDTALNGEEGIKWIRLQKRKIEECLIILLDIRMPIMDGFGFLEAFNSIDLEVQNKTSIVMLSSTLDPNDIERAQQNRFVKKLLSKPLVTQELISVFQ